MQSKQSVVITHIMAGLRLILDLVPNHSSDQHEWFAKSLKKEEPYSDYYVWAKPKNHAQVAAKGAKPEPPNNWVKLSPIISKN
jgi:glycosidase